MARARKRGTRESRWLKLPTKLRFITPIVPVAASFGPLLIEGIRFAQPILQLYPTS
jgi:hypothetical protein